MKTCTKCNACKSDSQFYADGTKRDGRHSWCIACSKKKSAEFRRLHPEVNRERSNRNRLKNGRTYDLRKLYGITAEQYDAVLASQGGTCAICQAPPGLRRLAVDHSHTNQKNRGLLCVLCNHAIERLENDPDWGMKALNYLARYIEQTVKV